MLFSPKVFVTVEVGCHSDRDSKAPIFSCLLTLMVDISLALFMTSFDF